MEYYGRVPYCEIADPANDRRAETIYRSFWALNGESL